MIPPTATSVTTVATAERDVPTPETSASPNSEESVRARPIWRGDYETGTFSQWSDVQASRTNREYPVSSVGDSSAVVLSAPVRQGTRAAEFVTYPNTGHAEADRSEVLTSVSETGGFEGQEWYYAWSTRFPSAGNPQGFWSEGGDFNVFTQWHSANDPCGNNLQFGVDSATAPGTNRLYSDLTTKNPRECDQDVRNVHAILGRLRFDAWYDFVVRVKWSSDPTVGFYEAWMNGIQVVPKTYGQTMFDSRGAYWKQGFYRAAFRVTNSVYEDGAVRGPSLEAVTSNFRLSFAALPRLRARNALDVSARSFAQARLSIVVSDDRGRVVGSRRVRSDGDGRVRSIIPIRKRSASRLRVSLRALVSPRLPVATSRAQIVVALPR
jgi:hypothetical protein